jgi:hypothetical protein
MDRSAELIVTSRPILFLSGLMFWLPHKKFGLISNYGMHEQTSGKEFRVNSGGF